MSKPVRRFEHGKLVYREGKRPLGLLTVRTTREGHMTRHDCVRTSRVIEAKFNEDGTVCRLETLNTIYVQVKE